MEPETFKDSKTRHGTASGWSKHKNDGDMPCDACARAKAAYDADWRSTTERRRKSRQAAAAQSRALKRLKDMHPAEYAAMYAEEKQR